MSEEQHSDWIFTEPGMVLVHPKRYAELMEEGRKAREELAKLPEKRSLTSLIRKHIFSLMGWKE